ncbi:Polycystic kidney disease [Actinidia chinensis var. chinensis]|uniref:Polycystic kidney disease n=1 Tax=Actinidia chinensis var. chinensis TaxID=1590841 RepID=A0A2R6PB65_ACTCC|nr:Polycystic kidney disease [Actinidia chinensis var. chinensis]
MAITVRNKRSNRLLIPRTSLASVESLTMPLIHEVVLLADFQCEECQKRVADIVSRINGETESVVVSVLEKEVTLTCRSYTASVIKAPTRQVTTLYQKSKITVITRGCFAIPLAVVIKKVTRYTNTCLL